MADSSKGKWKVYESPFAPAVIIDRPRKLIATCRLELGSEGMGEAEANAHLIVNSVNACQEVSPDNPMAVAESIKDMYEALKTFIEYRLELDYANPTALSLVTGKIQQALAKAEGKGQ